MTLRRIALFAQILQLSLLLAQLVSAETPAAPDRKEADRHFQQGLAYAKEERLHNALAEFQRAFEIEPHFAVLYNIGQLYARLGSPARAVAALEQYLAGGGGNVSPERRGEAERLIAQQRAMCGEVELRLAQTGVRVYVDSQGPDPLPPGPLLLDPGVHHLLFTKPGFEVAQRRIRVAAGDQHRASVILKRLPTSGGTLTIQCPRSGVELVVDGKPRGHTPFRAPLELAAGSHMVEFIHRGKVVRQVKQRIGAAGPRSVSCGLGPDPSTSANDGTRSADDGDVELPRHWAYTLGGTGLALGAVAITSLVIGQKKHRTYASEQDRLNQELKQGPVDESWFTRQNENNDLFVQVQALDLVATGCGVGAAAALAGAGFFLLGRTANTQAARSRLLPPLSIGWRSTW